MKFPLRDTKFVKIDPVLTEIIGAWINGTPICA